MADRKMYRREDKLEVLELACISGKINAAIERELELYQRQMVLSDLGAQLCVKFKGRVFSRS